MKNQISPAPILLYKPGFASCGYADLFNGRTLEVDLTLPLVNPPIEQGLSGNSFLGLKDSPGILFLAFSRERTRRPANRNPTSGHLKLDVPKPTSGHLKFEI